MVVYAPAQVISAPAQLITAPAQVISAPAQLPATKATVYTALLNNYHPKSIRSFLLCVKFLTR